MFIDSNSPVGATENNVRNVDQPKAPSPKSACGGWHTRENPLPETGFPHFFDDPDQQVRHFSLGT
jgi:hypothetical protein